MTTKSFLLKVNNFHQKELSFVRRSLHCNSAGILQIISLEPIHFVGTWFLLTFVTLEGHRPMETSDTIYQTNINTIITLAKYIII